MTVIVMQSIVLCLILFPAIGHPFFRIEQYKVFEKNQDYLAALDIIRDEIADPVSTSNEYLADLRGIAIGAMYKYADFQGLQPWMDEEAARYYEEGLRFAKNDEARQVNLHSIFGTYYSWTDRNGLAIPYIRKEMEYWEKVNNTYHIIKTYYGLASAYGDMGRVELRDYYREKALKLAKEYFILGKQPSDAHQWVQYRRMLRKRMDDIARPGKGAEIIELWGTVEPIVKKYVTPEYVSYHQIAEYMAIAGDRNRARKFYKQAEEIGKKEDHPFFPRDHACVASSIHLHLGDYETGVREADRCMELWLSSGGDPGPNNYRIDALLHEGAGDLDLAINSFRESIKRFEITRSSYSVSERATFFRSIVRRSYWGLIRCYSKRTLTNKNAADFLAALQASELVRGRQFGELMDERSEERMTLESLQELRNYLGSDEILLDYIFMDQEIVLFALTKDTQVVFVVPYDREGFRRQVLALVKGLATPSSNLHGLEQQLTSISRKILDPVRGMVKGKRRIVVLPDGILNAVPFDLLTLEQTGYRAMIEDKVVRIAPSIKYLVRSYKQGRHRRAAGLFALADPTFDEEPRIGGLSGTELRAVARGNKYLAYFKSLPETRTEAESIAKMFKGKPVKIFYGADASESALKKADLLPYDYLHLATHGILGGDVPGINEPALVLAAETAEDGFFTASEAADLKLDAELAVLSACNTGVGKYFTGEGVMGMSRSFLLAGSRSVLVSLWSVPSKETEQLMVAFYKYLRAGDSPPEAIRRAKLEMMKDRPPQVSKNVKDRGIIVPQKEKNQGIQTHPFYWAAFIPFGM
jgi:CHAT domain-containing protein